MKRKGSVEAQWFIVFGIVLVAITSLALFFRIGSIMENQDFFYEFHSDQMIGVIESMTTTRNPTSIIYNMGELEISSLTLKKKDDENAELVMQPRGAKELIVPLEDNYDVEIQNERDSELLMEYFEGSFSITPLQECSDNSDISLLNIYYHNPRDMEISNPDIYVYVVALNRDYQCRIKNHLLEQNSALERTRSIATAIQSNLGIAYEENYDAIITYRSKR